MPRMLIALFVSGCVLFNHPPSSTPQTPDMRFENFTVYAEYTGQGWRQEWIVTPRGKRIAGAPFGLHCELSYRCLIQAFAHQGNTIYLLSSQQIYRYDEISDEFYLDSDLEFPIGPGNTANDVRTVLSVDHAYVLGLLVFSDTWTLIPLANGRRIKGYPLAVSRAGEQFTVHFNEQQPAIINRDGTWEQPSSF